MQSTRHRILDYLKAEHSASAKDMASAFGMSRVNIHHHLQVLLSESKVFVATERFQSGRGRPEQLYALSTPHQPDSSARLMRGLLTVLSDPEPGKRIGTRLKRLAAKLVGNVQRPEGHITHRLVNAVKHLDVLGYRPHWEAQPEGPEIVLGLCPYASLVTEHPELCQMDTHIIQLLLDEKVEHKSKLVQGPDGLPQCVFKLQSQS
jgi:predicted ArsR family transcriptional regulator